MVVVEEVGVEVVDKPVPVGGRVMDIVLIKTQ